MFSAALLKEIGQFKGQSKPNVNVNGSGQECPLHMGKVHMGKVHMGGSTFA
jgi:hypothetical protein